jgi:uncharacterized protein involved in exopolysaccharide biosynthesis
MAEERRRDDASAGSEPPDRHDTGAILRNYLAVLWKRRWLIGFTLVATMLSAWIFTKMQVRIYQASATVLIEPEAPRFVNIPDVTPLPGATDVYYATQHKLIESRSIVEPVIKNLKLVERLPALATARDPYWAFFSALTVAPVKNTRLVMISFEDPAPALAVEVANAVANEYVKYNLSLKHRNAREAAAWLEGQLGDLRGNVERSAAALQTYQAKADLLGIQEQRQVTVSKIVDVNRAYMDAQKQRLEVEARRRELARILRDPAASEDVWAVVDNPLIQKLKTDVLDLQAERAKLAQLYTEKHPDLLQIDAQVRFATERFQAEVQKLDRAVENEYRLAKAREQDLSRTLNEARREAQELTAREARASALDMDSRSNDELLATVLKRFKEAGLSTALDASNIRVVEPATRPTSPIRPRAKLIRILSVMAGLALGVGLAFLAEALDNRIRSPEDLERALGLPVLGVVPLFGAKRNR